MVFLASFILNASVLKWFRLVAVCCLKWIGWWHFLPKDLRCLPSHLGRNNRFFSADYWVLQNIGGNETPLSDASGQPPQSHFFRTFCFVWSQKKLSTLVIQLHSCGSYEQECRPRGESTFSQGSAESLGIGLKGPNDSSQNLQKKLDLLKGLSSWKDGWAQTAKGLLWKTDQIGPQNISKKTTLQKGQVHDFFTQKS